LQNAVSTTFEEDSTMRRQRRSAMLVLLAAATVGCVINPVTGERELALVSAEDEVAIGRNQYLYFIRAVPNLAKTRNFTDSWAIP
jgi:hypothetical protein